MHGITPSAEKNRAAIVLSELDAMNSALAECYQIVGAIRFKLLGIDEPCSEKPEEIVKVNGFFDNAHGRTHKQQQMIEALMKQLSEISGAL